MLKRLKILSHHAQPLPQPQPARSAQPLNVQSCESDLTHSGSVTQPLHVQSCRQSATKPLHVQSCYQSATQPLHVQSCSKIASGPATPLHVLAPKWHNFKLNGPKSHRTAFGQNAISCSASTNFLFFLKKNRRRRIAFWD